MLEKEMLGSKVIKNVFSLAAVVLLVGCDGSGSFRASSGGSPGDEGEEGDGGSVQVGAGSLSLAITDAPIDGAQNVYVEFTAIEIKPADGTSKTITLDSPTTIDLLAQQGGNSFRLISDEEVPSGDYNWMRLAVNAEHDNVMDSYIVLSDGGEHELEVPSGSKSGLKLNGGFTVPDGGSANFTIDFDLRHSIVKANDKYKLKPVLRLIDNAGAATITGTVDSTLIASECVNSNVFSGAAYIFTGHDITPDDIDVNSPNPIATASVKLNIDATAYEYTAAFLSSGNYTITYTCDSDDADVDDAVDFQPSVNVTLTEGATKTVNFD